MSDEIKFPELDHAERVFCNLLAAADKIEGGNAALIERMAAWNGTAIAMIGQGDPEATNKLLEGSIAYMTERAVSHSRVGKLIADAKRAARRTG